MITRVLRRTSHAGNAELAAAALIVVVGAIDPAPGMTTTDRDPPTLRFRMLERFLDFLLRVRGGSHGRSPVW